MNPKELDIQKRIIEVRYSKDILKILKLMNKDAVALYKATNSIPQSLASNYTLEFKKVIRDILRASIKQFGFMQRSRLEKEFNIPRELTIFDRQIDSKELLYKADTDIEKVNNDFALQVISFVVTESDRQALYIEETNAKELEKAQIDAIVKLNKRQAKLQSLIDNINSKIGIINFNILIKPDPKESEKLRRLLKRLGQLQQELDNLKANSKDTLDKYVQENLEAKEEFRAMLIAEMSVGISSNWAMSEEVAILALSLGITFTKTWNGIVDGRQRPSHFRATGQTVNADEDFIVGGYRAKYPYDPRLPMSEKARCRCSVRYN